MIKNAIEARLRERIEQFVQELDLLVRKSALEALRGVLTGSAQPAGGRGRGRRGPGRLRSRAGSSADGAVGARVLAQIQGHPGQTISEIGAALGASAKELRKPVLALLAARAIHTTGQRRGTRYHAGGGGAGAPRAGARRGRRKKRAARKA